MKRTAFITTTLAGFSVFAAGQTDVAHSPKPEHMQTVYGVLMDASCPAISGASHSGTSGANSIVSGNGVKGSKAAGSQAGMEGPSGADLARRTQTEMPRKSKTEVSKDTQLEVPRSTSATASGAGTTGAYAGNGMAGTGGVLAGQTGSPVGRRSATEEPAFLSVKEKYRECMVKPGTTVFAVHADGKLMLLDQASDEMIQDRMRSGAFSANMSDSAGNPKFTSVTLEGTKIGDRFKATSMQAGGAVESRPPSNKTKR